MKRYIDYKLHLQEPLVIGNGNSTGNIVRSADYISGSTIHGLFANLYIKKHCTERAVDPGDDPNFTRLFFSDQVHFLNAYPYYSAADVATTPMPLTVMGCKYFGNGDYTSGATEHGLVDTVFDPKNGRLPCQTDGCPQPVQHRDGYLYRYSGQLRRTTVAKRIDMHNQAGEKEKPPQVYALEAIERGQTMCGHIAIDEAIYEDFYTILHDLLWADEERPGNGVRLGRAKNRGYGLCAFTRFGKTDKPAFDSMTPPAYFQSGTDTFISVYCYSDIALKDGLGRPLPTIGTEHIVPGEPKSLELRPDLSCWQLGTFTGFNNKKRMPGRQIHMIKKGSVFVYRVADQAALDDTELPHTIGEHKNIGFGRVLYNHHWKNGQDHELQ